MRIARVNNENEEWRADALCNGIGPSIFYPVDENGEPNVNYKVLDEEGNPGQFCLNCPVQQQCLNYAVALEIRDGIFGGTNETTRRKLININARNRRNESRDRRNAAKNK